MKDDFFSSRTVTVKKGTTLKFVWQGEDDHNVKATGAARFTSKFQETGTYSKRVTRAGTIKIVCTAHSGMKMTVIVK